MLLVQFLLNLFFALEEGIYCHEYAVLNTARRCPNEEGVLRKQERQANRKAEAHTAGLADHATDLVVMVSSELPLDESLDFVLVESVLIISNHGVTKIIVREHAHSEKAPEVSDYSIQQELVKQFVIMVSNTPPDPRTMVVHSQNALATNRAVMRSRRLQPITVLTIPVHQQVLQVHPSRRETIAPLDSGEHMLPTDLDLLLRLPERLLLVLGPKVWAILLTHICHFDLHIAVALSHFLYMGTAFTAPSRCSGTSMAQVRGLIGGEGDLLFILV